VQRADFILWVQRWRRSLPLLPIVLLWLAIGCNGSGRHGSLLIPPCPIPTMEAVNELRGGEIPPGTESYLKRLKVYCDAVDDLRG